MMTRFLHMGQSIRSYKELRFRDRLQWNLMISKGKDHDIFYSHMYPSSRIAANLEQHFRMLTPDKLSPDLLGVWE